MILSWDGRRDYTLKLRRLPICSAVFALFGAMEGDGGRATEF